MSRDSIDLSELREAFCDDPEGQSPLDEPAWKDLPGGDFLKLAEPLVRRAFTRLRRGARELGHAHRGVAFDPERLSGSLLAQLARRLAGRLERTMILELHVAALESRLEGESSEQRLHHFVERICECENTVALFAEYPVLARQLVLAAELWVRSGLELVERFCSDWQALRRSFSPTRDPGELVGARSGISDPHRGGRSVTVLTFTSGLKLVYKPKPLAVEVLFQELLAWVDERRFTPSLPRLEILDRGAYGWIEFVAPEACRTRREVERFYERQGAYLALLYALEATDLHRSNVIASGEHPVLIDLEALFHPCLDASDIAAPEPAAEPSRAPHAWAYEDSVLRIGLLPQRSFPGVGETAGVDLSGLGGSAGQRIPGPAWRLSEPGTDRMRFLKKHVSLPPGRHLPTLNGTEVRSEEYTEAIATGFARLYRLLRSHRAELLATGGPIRAFRESEVRVIVRPSRAYLKLLDAGFHPDVLRDAADRDRLFDRLRRSVERSPFLARLVPAEKLELERGDVPIFHTRPGSRDLWSGTGERFASFFATTGLERVERRVRGLSEGDLERQLGVVRGAMAALALSTGCPPPALPGLPDGGRAARTEELLDAASSLGERLEELAFRRAGEATWFGLRAREQCRWNLEPLSPDLYDGLAGVAFFLAYLGERTGRDLYRELARDAITSLLHQIGHDTETVPTVGALSGWGGIVYTLTHLGSLWGEAELLDAAEEIVEHLPEKVAAAPKSDLVGGTAGCLASLLVFRQCHGSQKSLDVAVQCGERLLTQARPVGHGLGWPSPSASQPLTGFAHGAAGIAWALGKLAMVTGEERFRRAARAAIAYERGLYSPAKRNWPDLRGEAGTAARYACDWCHGAPGIGLARLDMLALSEEEEMRAEIAVAIETTLTHGFGRNHSLCHGDLGNLDFLLTSAIALGDAELRLRVERLAARVLAGYKRVGWRCGLLTSAETPGLMVGLAGIGHGLLRLAEPGDVPSVLRLESVPRPPSRPSGEGR